MKEREMKGPLHLLMMMIREEKKKRPVGGGVWQCRRGEMS
jgi:hypothetical protein